MSSAYAYRAALEVVAVELTEREMDGAAALSADTRHDAEPVTGERRDAGVEMVDDDDAQREANGGARRRRRCGCCRGSSNQVAGEASDRRTAEMPVTTEELLSDGLSAELLVTMGAMERRAQSGTVAVDVAQ